MFSRLYVHFYLPFGQVIFSFILAYVWPNPPTPPPPPFQGETEARERLRKPDTNRVM